MLRLLGLAFTRCGLAGLAGVALVSPVAAQAPRALLDCTSILSDAERLACYDTTVKAFSSEARAVAERREAQAAKLAAAAAAASAAAAAAQRSDGFGKANEARIERIDSTLKELMTDSTSKSVYVLDNGQIWRQADGYRIPNARPGAAITIKRGAMGSYRLSVAGGNRSVQVVRMR